MLKSMPKAVVAARRASDQPPCGGILVLLLAVAFLSGPAAATDYTWTGGGSNDGWTNKENWGGTPIVAANTNNAIFAGTTRLEPNQNIATIPAPFLSVQFSSTAGSFTIRGNPLQLGDYASGTTPVLVNAAASVSHALSNDIAFNTATPTINAGTSGTFTLSGLLTDGTGAAVTELRHSNGTLFLTNAANSFSGRFASYGVGSSVNVTQLANAGSNSPLGAGAAIRLGNANNPGTLRYTGGQTSSNRQFVFGSNTTSATGSGTIESNGSGPVTFSNAAFNGSTGATADSSRTITLAGTNAGDNTISGAIIDNNATAAIAVTKSGAGRWVLSGDSSYTGGTSVSAGTLVIGHANALGGTAAGTTVSSGATLGIQGGITTAAEPVTISGTGGDGNGALVNLSGTNTISGTVTLAADATVGVSAGRLTLASSVGGNFGLTKSGAGTLVLSGSNTTTLPLSIQSGQLLVDGTTAGTGGTTVAVGGLLGGSGRIDGPVEVQGTLSPGDSTGLLTLASLELKSTATTAVELDGLARVSLYDGIDITTPGGLTYGGVLSIAFGLDGPVADQTTFDLFSFTGTPAGNFSSVTSTGVYNGTWSEGESGRWLLQSGNQTLTFSVDSGDIVIVPEPGRLLLAAGAVAGAVLAVRRRRG